MRRLLVVSVLVGLALTGPAYAGGAAPSKSQSRLTSAESFLPLPPVLAATPAGRGIGGMLTVELGLDIPNQRLRERVTTMRPRILDALRTAVSQYALTYLPAGAPPDPVRIAAMTQASLDRLLGEQGAKVLLSNIMITERR